MSSRLGCSRPSRRSPRSAALAIVGRATTISGRPWTARSAITSAEASATPASRYSIGLGRWDSGRSPRLHARSQHRRISKASRSAFLPAACGHLLSRQSGPALRQSTSRNSTSLQTKVVDGQENPTSVIKSAKFYEVQKYLSLTSHMWDMNWLIISQRLWRRYPADVTSLVSRIVNEQALIQRDDLAAQNAKGIDDLRTLGLAVNTPDAAPFREKLRASGFYKEWKEKFGAAAWAALEKYTGPIS